MGLAPAFAITLALITAYRAPARAQSGAAEAEQLFRDGKRLMQEKKFAEACGAFDTSYKLDPALTTKLNLADCREKNGQLATAWGLFVDAERDTRADARQKALNKTAKDRATALEPRLSYLTISVADESRVEGLTIQRNGAPFDEGLWNRAVPVDGGAIVIAGRAPGHEEWATTANVPLEGAKISVEVPRFKELKKLVVHPRAQEVATEELKKGDEERRWSDATRTTFTRRRKVAVAVAAGGVIAIGVGVVLGVKARGLRNDALALCPGNPCGSADQANAGIERARENALSANIGYGVGTVALAGAAILWFAGAPDPVRARSAFVPRLSPEFAGVDVSGSF